MRKKHLLSVFFSWKGLFAHFVMKDHKLRAVDLANFLQISKDYMSDILNYKKGFSKEVIRKLAERFKIQQEAFNRKYKRKK